MSQQSDDRHRGDEGVPSREPASGVVAIDLFAARPLQAVLQLDEPVKEYTPHPPEVKSWRSVWVDCGAHLQSGIVGLAEFIAAVPRNCTRLLNAIGSGSENLAELVRRIARGRAKGDHQQDEKESHANEIGAPLDPEEINKLNLRASLRFRDLERRLATRGVRLIAARLPGCKVALTAVSEENAVEALKLSQDRLQELTPAIDVNLIEDHVFDDEVAEAERRAEKNDLPLEVMKLPKRAAIALQQNGMSTVRDVAGRTPDEIRQIPGIGPATINQIAAFLSKGSFGVTAVGWAVLASKFKN